MTCGVYVIRDAAGVALYVGSSRDIATRLRQHEHRSPSWWPEMASVEEIPTETRHGAYDLERRKITELKPTYNVASKDGAKRVSRATGPVVVPRAEVLARLIDQHGTVAALARVAGVDHQTMSQIWRGVYFPSSKVVARLMTISGLSFEELFAIEVVGDPSANWLADRPGRKAVA